MQPSGPLLRLEELQSLRLCHDASDTCLPAALDIRALVCDIVREKLHGHCSSCAPPSPLTSAPTNLWDIIRQEIAPASHPPCSAESRHRQVPMYAKVVALSALTTIPAATPGGHVPVASVSPPMRPQPCYTGPPPPRPICYYCGYRGHISRFCQRRQRDEQRGYATEERGRSSPLMNYQRTPYRFCFQRSLSPPYSMGLPVNSLGNSPGSAHLTVRFLSVKTSDDKELFPNHTVSVYDSSVASRHLSCYSNMEARADGYTYNGKKEEPSTTTITSTATDVVSSSSPLPGSEQGLSSMAESSTLNGSASDTHGEDALSEEPLRKRRRSSNDSTNGTLTPTSKGRSSRGDKARASDSDAQCPRKRGNNSSSDTESGPSEQEMDGDPSTQDSYGNGHSPKVPPLKIVLPSSGTGNLEGAEPAGGANSKERKVSSSKPALPYVVNATESLSEGSPTSPEESPPPMEEVSQPVTNGFQMYLDIRKQVEKRRQAMLVVHPKPPQGFKDYLLNRGSYVLEGNPSSRLSVPMIPLPQSLSGSPMRDLFLDQERERYKLRLQHLIEREKLVLSAEQEILRVHGRAARAIQNQAVPLSACSILRDEEIYNVLKPEQWTPPLSSRNA
ncbi:hypothetical protein HPB51_023899 [Rhipicephalus microplus]|uniref:CCHC-type domain-containing protein n=1 Tax=Rhipicephalus microplus TaxID=6941 RepID=A0A9J6DD76_RHIMP|nr:hypothetical protein HPB51_023899 [Rhipicephalus microplus]